MIHPDTELRFINARIGFGVVARKKIPRGTITWVRDPLDRSFTEDAIATLGPLYRHELEKYCFIGGTGEHILCWDIARYVNHSCDARCLAAGWDFELAVRDIEAGEELTDDYGALNLTEPFDCACGAPSCRRILMPGEHHALADGWDAKVRAAFPSLGLVAQPLWPLVAEKAAVTEAVKDPNKMLSCRAHLR